MAYIRGVYGEIEMPVRFKLKLSKVGNSLRLTIPKPVAESLDLEEGDMLLLSVYGHKISVRKQGGRKR
jgi:AbrB family looped-hinge helix DNA binding protein